MLTEERKKELDGLAKSMAVYVNALHAFFIPTTYPCWIDNLMIRIRKENQDLSSSPFSAPAMHLMSYDERLTEKTFSVTGKTFNWSDYR